MMQAAQSNASPKISVIIPSYQTAHLIVECLDSVLAQTYKDFEVIVVNDGSPDTPELEKALQPYMDRIVYIKQENKRAAGARNTGIQRARGEFLAFVDSDDSWYPDHLAEQMQLFAEDPSLDLVYANALQFGDPAGEREFVEKCPSAGPATFEALIVGRCQVASSTVVARKQAIVRAGLFDEQLPRCDDYEMWTRAAFSGARIGYSRTVQARLFIARPGSLSQSRAKMTEAYWSILEKFKRTLPLKDADRAVVDKRAAEIRSWYLLEEGKCKLVERQFEKARQLIAEANSYLHKSSLSLAVFGLGVAPRATAKLISCWKWIRNGASA